MGNATQRERALAKLQLEIKKDISVAVKLAKACGLMEFLMLPYLLHFVRLRLMYPAEDAAIRPELYKVHAHATIDSLKYMIGLTAKYGSGHLAVSRETGKLAINQELVDKFLFHTNYINSKYESKALLQLAEVEVWGERDRYAKIYVPGTDSDPQTVKLFQYFLRVDMDGTLQKGRSFKKEELLSNFQKKYGVHEDLFRQEMGISVEEYAGLIDTLLTKIVTQTESKKAEFEYLKDDIVDINSLVTFVHFATAMVVNKQQLLAEIGVHMHSALERMIFQPEKFEDEQLRFHYVTRQPLIPYKDSLIVSPELVLDSLFTNVHYSILEAEDIKQEYIKREASRFLDEIAAVAAKFGYREVTREMNLYEGKKEIGDIDLVLGDEAGNYLLVEAKNHALPMDVLFHEVQGTLEHLARLQDKWENKVRKRIEYLEEHHTDVGIPKNYIYIVVSKLPEVISHFSEILILSQQEFPHWLEKYKSKVPFEKIYEDIYSRPDPSITIAELDQLQSANILFGKFVKE